MNETSRLQSTITNLLTVLLFALLLACQPQDQAQTAARTAVAIEKADECHVCGMIIKNLPGPKGEIDEKHAPAIKKFCSVKELFSYMLQPENKHRTRGAWVHDMSQTPWDKPGDEHFIAAEDAWYVHGSSRQAAMGTTLASFQQQASAEAFAKKYGGELVRFEEITLELLSSAH